MAASPEAGGRGVYHRYCPHSRSLMRGNTSAWADPRSTGRCYASLVPPNGMSHQRLPESPSACASGFPGLQVSSPVAPRSCPHSGAAPGVQSRVPPKGRGRFRTIAEQSMQHARKAKILPQPWASIPSGIEPHGRGLYESITLKKRGPSWGSHRVVYPLLSDHPMGFPMGVGCW